MRIAGAVLGVLIVLSVWMSVVVTLIMAAIPRVARQLRDPYVPHRVEPRRRPVTLVRTSPIRYGRNWTRVVRQPHTSKPKRRTSAARCHRQPTLTVLSRRNSSASLARAERRQVASRHRLPGAMGALSQAWLLRGRALPRTRRATGVQQTAEGTRPRTE